MNYFRSTPHLQSHLSALFYTSFDLTSQGGIRSGLLFAPGRHKDSDDIMTSVQEEVYCELYASA